MMGRRVCYLIAPIFIILSLMVGACGRQDGLSCRTSEECFRGEQCVDEVCSIGISEPGEGDGGSGGGPGGRSGPEVRVKAVAAGVNHTCAIDEKERVHCWGVYDPHGGAPPQDERFKQIVSGAGYSCGLTVDQRVKCWGSLKKEGGELPEGKYKYISGGYLHLCGITMDDEVICRGRIIDEGPAGQFESLSSGDGYTCGVMLYTKESRCWGESQSLDLTRIVGLFESISAGDVHVCAIRVNGVVTCWGDNYWGEVEPPPVSLREIGSGHGFSCGITREEHKLKCWGESSKGQLAHPDGRFRTVSAGWGHACAIDLKGGLQCWGKNDKGQTNVPEVFR